MDNTTVRPPTPYVYHPELFPEREAYNTLPIVYEEKVKTMKVSKNFRIFLMIF